MDTEHVSFPTDWSCVVVVLVELDRLLLNQVQRIDRRVYNHCSETRAIQSIQSQEKKNYPCSTRQSK